MSTTLWWSRILEINAGVGTEWVDRVTQLCTVGGRPYLILI